MVKTLTGQNSFQFNTEVFTFIWNEKIDSSTIRKKIIECLSSELSDSEKQEILNIHKLPKSKNFYFSISHSPAGSGFAASKNPVGIDIEAIQRTQSPALIKRVSTIEEQKILGHQFGFLIWSLKESAFKKLNPFVDHLKTISQLRVENILEQNLNHMSVKMSFDNHKTLTQCQWDKERVICISD